MPFIIDGHNFMHRIGAAGSPEGCRLAVDRVQEVCARRGGRYLVVFDGPPSGGFVSDVALDKVSVRFSGNRSADSLILSLLNAQAQVRGATVVTTDRGLASSCLALGASVVSCHEFLLAPAPPTPRSPRGKAEKPTHVDVREWEDYFSTKKVSRSEKGPGESPD